MIEALKTMLEAQLECATKLVKLPTELWVRDWEYEQENLGILLDEVRRSGSHDLDMLEDVVNWWATVYLHVPYVYGGRGKATGAMHDTLTELLIAANKIANGQLNRCISQNSPIVDAVLADSQAPKGWAVAND